MSCDDARRLLAAYHDGELDAIRASELEQHIHGCASCNAALENLCTLSQVTKSASFTVPADLRASLTAALRRTESKATTVHPFRFSHSWLTSGLSLAAAAMFGFFIARTLYRPSANEPLLAQLTDSHLRSLIGTHLTDVANSDQHTVRPWFEGKLDFAPPIEDLSAHGFPLLGGRVDYIAGRAVAVLVYQRRQHFINLFIWPTAGASEIRSEAAQRGYNVVDWRDSGMSFWALSEVNENELRQFAREFRGAMTTR